MRIVQVNYAYGDDLTDPETLLDRYTTLTGWSAALAGSGCEVSVVQRFRRDGRCVRAGVEYFFRADGAIGDPRSRLWPRRLHREVLARQPDVVHVNGMDVPLQAWFLRRALSSETALVVQHHGGGEPVVDAGFGRRAVGLVKRTAMQSVDAFLFTAAAQAGPWRRAGLIAPHQPVLQVMEGSTTLRPMDPVQARQASGLEGDPGVLWVGRLNANKAPLTILDGFERTLDRLPGAVLTMIYGADDQLPAVTARLQAAPALAGRVRLLGSLPHERMAAFYSAADLFVLGSHHEGSGYALIEACACGVAPVVTDIPAFRVITDDGAIGALWPADDPAALANALVTVAARDRSISRRRVLEHFDRALSWQAVGRAAHEAYVGVLAARATR